MINCMVGLFWGTGASALNSTPVRTQGSPRLGSQMRGPEMTAGYAAGTARSPCVLNKASLVFRLARRRLCGYAGTMHSKTDMVQSSAEALRYPWENHPGQDQVV